MTKRITTGLMIAFLLITPAVSVSGNPSQSRADDSPLVCWALPSLMGKYYQKHVQYTGESKDLDARFVKLFSERLDPAETLLLENDFAQEVKRVSIILSDVRQGRCESLHKLHERQVTWHREMAEFVKTFTQNAELTIDRTLELQVDPDKRPRASNASDRDTLRRKMLHFQLANYVAAGTPLAEAKTKIAHRYDLIARRFADRTQADLYSNFLNAFSNALDPHSTYFSAEDLEDFRISMNLSLEGIGAQLSSRDGYTVVSSVIPGGAADREGQLKAKDRIVAVSQMPDGKAVDVIDMELRHVVRLIRGKKGTAVKLTVLRQGESTETFNIVIQRDKIDLKDSAAKLSWQTIERGGKSLKLAMIDLPSFYGGDRKQGARSCTEDVRRLLREAVSGGADGLVLDLSTNGGGLLKAAVDISGFFIKEGPVVMVHGPSNPRDVLEDTDSDIQFNGPLVVLTSRVSASASEILAGAVKDYGRAVVVGDDHTFGKGTVQNIVALPPGFGALKVTTQNFFRPGGLSTQSRGVAADVRLPSLFNNDEYGERHQPYALPEQSLEQFRGLNVNSKDPAKRWRPVTQDEIKQLSQRSAERVAVDPEFAKIREDLAKQRKNQGVIKIKEILDDPDKQKDDEEKEKEELSTQAKEALQVLADLVMLRQDTQAASRTEN